MVNYRKLVSQDDYKIQLQKCVEKFSADFKRGVGSTVFIKTEKNLVTAVTGSDSGCLAFELQGSNRVESIFLTLLREACDKAEGVSGCSSQLLVNLLLVFLRKQYSPKNIEEFIKSNLYTSSQTVDLETFDSVMMNVVDQDKLIADIIKNALQLAGFEGKIIIDEKTGESTTLVEYHEGYTFQISPARSFYNQPNTTWDQPKVKVFIVDGIIQSVSELHGILTKSYESKLPLLLVARGFGEEVLATLKANQTYSLLNALPVKINSDLESINILNDIAVVAGASICSSLTGDVISLTDYDALPVVDNVHAAGTTISIMNNKTRGSIVQHVKNLIKKKEIGNEVVEDVNDLIDKRIKSLISNNVTIKLPNISDARKTIMKANLDHGFRTAKAVINYGVVTKSKLFEQCDNEFKSILAEALKDIPEPIPVLALAAALKLSTSTASFLLNSSVVLEVDQPA